MDYSDNLHSEEPPIATGLPQAKSRGISDLEYQVMMSPLRTSNKQFDGILVSRELSGENAIPSEKPVTRPFSEDDLRKYLTPLEFKTYEGAASLGIRSKLQQLNELVKSRKEANSPPETKPNPTPTTENRFPSFLDDHELPAAFGPLDTEAKGTAADPYNAES